MEQFILYKKEISDFLNIFLAQKSQELKKTYFAQDVFEKLISLAPSGKMWRGSLLINTYQKLTDQELTQEVLKAAVALELAQTGFLIHDDIIDQDELRRGQATLHTQYSWYTQQKNYRQPIHIGESMAICVGDIVFFLAYELVGGDLVKLFSKQLTMTALGEMHDVELALMSGGEVTKDNILQMYLDKTSSYSTCLPLMAGAVLAKQSAETIVQLNELGQTLGLIFQIKDDQLGLFGNEETIGKPIGADIREGKKTLFYYYLLQTVADKDELLQIFGNNDLTVTQIGKITELMKNHQIKALVNEDIKKLETKVKHQLERLSAPVKLKEMLTEFTVANLKREQ